MVSGSYGRNMFSFVRNHQTVFQSGCMVLHSQQHYVRVTVPHPHQHLVLSEFQTLTILIGVQWYLIILFAFPWWHMMQSIFSYAYFPLVYLFGEVSLNGLWPISKKVQIVLLLSFTNSLHILDDSLIRCIFCIFSQSSGFC